MSSISIGLVSRNEPHATAVRGGGSAPAATPMSNGSAGKPVTASRSATTGQSANRNLTRVTPAASATPPRTTTRVPFACPESTETDAAGVQVPAEQSSNLAAVRCSDRQTADNCPIEIPANAALSNANGEVQHMTTGGVATRTRRRACRTPNQHVSLISLGVLSTLSRCLKLS